MCPLSTCKCALYQPVNVPFINLKMCPLSTVIFYIQVQITYIQYVYTLSSEYTCRFHFDFWCFNATFNNISAISWRPVLVVEEAGVPGENHRPWTSNW